MAQKVTIEVTNVSRYRNICIGNATSGVRGLRMQFHMYCILIDAHLSDGDLLAMHDVFPLRGIDLFKVSARVC